MHVTRRIHDLAVLFVFEGEDHFHRYGGRRMDETTFQYMVTLIGGHPPDTRVRIYLFRVPG
jgi:hypothetical protein